MAEQKTPSAPASSYPCGHAIRREPGERGGHVFEAASGLSDLPPGSYTLWAYATGTEPHGVGEVPRG